MQEIRRILVVSRMSRFCLSALRFGISLSEKFGAQLFLLHVLYNPMTRGWSIPMISLEKERSRELEQMRRLLDDMVGEEKKKGLVIEEFVREGNPATEILKVIREEDIDLVILHAHEDGPYEKVFGFGNREIIDALPCSTLLVRDSSGR